MHTPSLRELQGLFWRSIAREPGTLQPIAGLLGVTQPSATLDPPARLAIYADAYLWRLRDILREDFPRLADALGPDRFDALARDYLRDHPSVDPSLRHLGRDLAGAMADRSDLPPYLGDLARLEWARLEVFDAPDSDVLTADSLRLVPADRWPALRFSIVPALTVVRAAWPVHRLWQEPGLESLAPAATCLRVWRAQEDRVFHAPMDASELRALERMAGGEPFEAVCAALAEAGPADAARGASALLARWLDDGILAASRSDY
jgi:hypothetical protein